MSESASIDTRWQLERRRVGTRAGLGFGALLLAFKAIERTGLLSPIFGSDVAAGGPFTLRWMAAVLGAALFAGVFFGLAIGWSVKPPSERASNA